MEKDEETGILWRRMKTKDGAKKTEQSRKEQNTTQIEDYIRTIDT